MGRPCRAAPQCTRGAAALEQSRGTRLRVTPVTTGAGGSWRHLHVHTCVRTCARTDTLSARRGSPVPSLRSPRLQNQVWSGRDTHGWSRRSAQGSGSYLEGWQGTRYLIARWAEPPLKRLAGREHLQGTHAEQRAPRAGAPRTAVPGAPSQRQRCRGTAQLRTHLRHPSRRPTSPRHTGPRRGSPGWAEQPGLLFRSPGRFAGAASPFGCT